MRAYSRKGSDMAEAIAGVRVDISANSAELDAALARASTSLRRAQQAGEQAGAQIAAALSRMGAALASAFAVDQIARFIGRSIEATAAIGRLAAAAGLSAQEFQGMQAALAGARLSEEQFSAGFATFSRNLDDLRRNTGPLLDFLRRFAPELESSFRAARSTSEAFGILTDAMNALGSEQERVRLATIAGGENFVRLIGTMRQGRTVIEQTAQSHQGLSDANRQTAEGIQRRWDDVWRNFDLGAKRAIFGVIDAITSLNRAGIPRTDIAAMEAALALIQRSIDGNRAMGLSTEALERSYVRLRQRIDEARTAATNWPSMGSAVAAIEAAARPLTLTNDQIRAMTERLSLLQAKLTTLPPQMTFFSQSFAQAWQAQFAVLNAQGATQDAIEAARLNMLRQQDAERQRILGNSISIDELMTRRSLELSQARQQGLITEAQRVNALGMAYAEYGARVAGGAAQAMSALASAFQQNKSFAVAAAVMNTAQAVTRTWAEWGWPLGVPFAAAQLAAGIAQISAIRSANPGGASNPPSVGGGAAGTGGDAGPTQAPQMLTLSIAPGLYSHDEVAAFAEQLGDHFVNGGSQNVLKIIRGK